MKKIFSQMKSHPTAVEVPARWAEVREARRDMPELSDFLKIQPDKSPVAEEPVQVAPKKCLPKPAESAERPLKLLKLQRQNSKNDQKHAVPAEAQAGAVSPVVPEAAAKLPVPVPTQGKAIAAAAAAPEGMAKAAVPESALAGQASVGQGESKAEVEAWKAFSQQMGPDWQKRFAAQAVKRLEKLKKKEKKGKEKKEKKKDKKEKAKAKVDKKDKQDKRKKGEKKDKKSKNEKGQKERGQKRGLLDDDDLDAQKGGRKRNLAGPSPLGKCRKMRHRLLLPRRLPRRQRHRPRQRPRQAERQSRRQRPRQKQRPQPALPTPCLRLVWLQAWTSHRKAGSSFETRFFGRCLVLLDRELVNLFRSIYRLQTINLDSSTAVPVLCNKTKTCVRRCSPIFSWVCATLSCECSSGKLLCSCFVSYACDPSWLKWLK